MYNNKKIIVINYSDKTFEQTRKICSSTAISKGKADEVIEYSPSSLEDDFIMKNKRILSIKRGAGLWIWKPYIILKTLNSMNENDYLFYVDGGTLFINKIELLIPSLEKSEQDIMTFELPLLTQEWTKNETQNIILSETNIKYIEDNQILAGYILMKNTPFTRKFMQNWLKYVQNEICILPNNLTHEINFWNFIEHREDQSIFSILCRVYGLEPFREPSQYGKFYFQYAWNKGKGLKWKKFSFRPKKYNNSSYPQILLSVRREDPNKVKKIMLMKNILNKIGFYNKWTYKLLKKSYYEVVKYSGNE